MLSLEIEQCLVTFLMAFASTPYCIRSEEYHGSLFKSLEGQPTEVKQSGHT